MSRKNSKASLVKVLSRFSRIVGTYRWYHGLSPYTHACDGLEKIGYPKPVGVSDKNHVTKHADVIGEYIKGKKSPAISNVYQSKNKSQDFYSTRKWLELRYKVLQKYQARCMCCGATRADGVQIHVDHIKPRVKFPELELDINNLQVLCSECNIGKSYKDDSDWRTHLDEIKKAP